MSNLVIGIPSYTDNTTLNPLATTGTFETNLPVKNLLSGARSRLGRLSTATTSYTITTDTGGAATRAVDFLWIARANILKAQGCTRIKLAGGTSGDICGLDTTFGATTLYGRESEDLILTSELANSTLGTLPNSTSNSTYILTIGRSGVDPSIKWCFSKFMFGAWFDFGRDPETIQIFEQSAYNARSNYNVFKFIWRGIAESVKDSAVASIIFNRPKGCILYTKDYHMPLLGRRVVHAMLDDYVTRYETEGFYTIELTFKEQI
jgi:hypothetical protein